MMEEEVEGMIMSALASLSPVEVGKLSASVLSETQRHHRRIAAVLSSPVLFSLTLHRLHSLSLPRKSLLIARHLLSSLRLLIPPPHHHHHHPLPPSLRDLDAVLLLLLLCDLRQHHPLLLRAPVPEWRPALAAYFLHASLSLSGLHSGAVLAPYVEALARCWRFVNGKRQDHAAAASAAVVVALPSVEVRSAGEECAICKEEMAEGRDVCELPCRHMFHWACVLAWLRNRNTCPCCRLHLPTDDVYAEINRLWGLLLNMSASPAAAPPGEYCTS